VCSEAICRPSRVCDYTALPDGTLCGGTAQACLSGSSVNDSLTRQSFSGDDGDLTAGVYAIYSGFYR
jgi:hypothetical protein